MPNRKQSVIDAWLKRLFPDDAPWQRRKKLKNLLVACLLGVALGALVMVFAWLQSKKQ